MTSALDPREARLALAVHRTTLQRWITIEYLLDRHLRQPMRLLEPALRAVLLTAGAQLLFMDRLPAHAVVDESVELARHMVRPGAAGVVNAVLRKLAALVDADAEPDGAGAKSRHAHAGLAWQPAPDRLPLNDGVRPLREPCLPSLDQLDRHLSVATSHPVALVRRWIASFGRAQAITVCGHGTLTPPTIVAGLPTPGPSPGMPRSGGLPGIAADAFVPHEQAGFAVWQGTHEQLVAALHEHPQARVQDPGAARAVAACASLQPRVILDYCAGRGTKTRQLAIQHPQAQIIAAEVDAARLTALRESVAGLANVQVTGISQLDKTMAGRLADLIVLDVPCSNTAVLARRPEARYRFSSASMEQLIALQRQIITRALTFAAPDAHILYSTCSLEPEENAQQVRWITQQGKARVIDELQTLPAGYATTYHDGAYHALLRQRQSV